MKQLGSPVKFPWPPLRIHCLALTKGLTQAPRMWYTEDVAKSIAAIRSPATNELWWAAGFIDADGTFPLGQTTLVVDACQKSPELLYRLQAIFGGRVYCSPYRTRGDKKAPPIWNWRVYGARALGVMQTLYPLLSQKRQNRIAHLIGLIRR